MKEITLQCTSCYHTIRRPVCDPYTGHFHVHGKDYEYTCPECRGQVQDITHRAGAVCACDIALRDITEDFHASKNLMYPWKVWRVESNPAPCVENKISPVSPEVWGESVRRYWYPEEDFKNRWARDIAERVDREILDDLKNTNEEES